MNSDQIIERLIAGRIVDDALAAGHTISVNDGGSEVIARSSDRAAILAAMFSTDEDYLVVFPADPKQLTRLGWVRLVYGNGTDVVSDHIDNAAMAALLEGANALADRLEASGGKAVRS